MKIFVLNITAYYEQNLNIISLSYKILFLVFKDSFCYHNVGIQFRKQPFQGFHSK